MRREVEVVINFKGETAETQPGQRPVKIYRSTKICRVLIGVGQAAGASDQ